MAPRAELCGGGEIFCCEYPLSESSKAAEDLSQGWSGVDPLLKELLLMGSLYSTVGELRGQLSEPGLTSVPCFLCHLSLHVEEVQGPGSTQTAAALPPEGRFPSRTVSSYSSCLWENCVPDERGSQRREFPVKFTVRAPTSVAANSKHGLGPSLHVP